MLAAAFLAAIAVSALAVPTNFQAPSNNNPKVKREELKQPNVPAPNPYEMAPAAKKRDDLGLSGPAKADALQAMNKVLNQGSGKRNAQPQPSSNTQNGQNGPVKRSDAGNNLPTNGTAQSNDVVKQAGSDDAKADEKRLNQQTDPEEIEKRLDAALSPDLPDDAFDKAANAELKRQDAEIQRILSDGEEKVDEKRIDAAAQEAQQQANQAQDNAAQQKRNAGAEKQQNGKDAKRANADQKAVPSLDGAQNPALPKQKRYFEYRKAMIGR